MRNKFHKTICPDFDRIDIVAEGSRGNFECLTISMMVANLDEGPVSITLRSDEAVKDLHYALTRYLDTIKGIDS